MRLMISVISAEEAREAMLGGAEILDVKNPAEGSLGAHFPRVIREIRSLAPGSIEVSAAIGDMPNLPGTAALAALGAATCGVDFVKVGLHGLRNEMEAVALVREVRLAVHGFGTQIIAAGYADFQRAGTLDPECLPRVAASAGVKGCLLDTAVKDGRPLFDFLKPEALRTLIEQAHSTGLVFALAGALQEWDLPVVRDLDVDIVGIRTAACHNNQRNGSLDTARVRRLHQLFDDLRNCPGTD